MYNRYIRGDSGQYRRIPVPDPPQQDPPPHQPPPPPDSGGYAPFHQNGDGPRYGSGPPPGRPPGGAGGQGAGGILSGLLRQLHLEHVDTGDLLLILILILLFKDGEDEEMLIALGLLLIL